MRFETVGTLPSLTLERDQENPTSNRQDKYVLSRQSRNPSQIHTLNHKGERQRTDPKEGSEG